MDYRNPAAETSRSASTRLTHSFTLIDLLVVIAIIAILAGILMPALQQARERSRTAGCVSNLKQLAQANELYSSDNKDYYAPYARFSGRDSGRTYPSPLWWGETASATETKFNERGYLSSYVSNNKSILVCETVAPLVKFGDDTVGGSYGYNANGVGGVGYMQFKETGKSSTNTDAYGQSVKSSSIRKPGSLIMFGDTVEAGGMRAVTALAAIDRIYGPDSYKYIHFRHSKRANIAWADGHVSGEQCSLPATGAKYALNLLGNTDVGDIFPPGSTSSADHTYYDTFGRANPAED